MTKADELNALADRCEREEPSRELDDRIWETVNGRPAYTEGEPFRSGNPPRRTRLPIPAYTTSIDAAVALEPKDAQEIVVRTYPNRGAYVRITLKSGKVVYCEKFAGKITEPMARCAAALRAMAAELP